MVPADSLDSATYGHGMRELAASCGLLEMSSSLSEDWDWAEA